MKLEWTKPAVNDLESIQEYIARDSEYYAADFVSRIFDVVEKMYSFSKSGRVVPEIKDETIREFLYYNYRIIYKIGNDVVIILAVIHGARDISNTHVSENSNNNY